MLHSFLRNASPYTRFLLQEERKQQNVFGSMIHMLGYRNLLFFEGLHNDRIIIPSDRQMLNKQHIPNLLLQLTEITQKTEKILKNQHQVRQNKIKTIQYEANNGIEDRIVGCKLKSINGQILCIFDGHGGDKLSNYCAQHIVQLIDTNLQQHFKNKTQVTNLDEIIINSLKYAYNKIQNDFYQNVFTELMALGDRKIKNVGSCALTAIVYNNKIYVANCGDSQAILVSQNSNKQISYTQLNQRLSVNNPVERQRMMKQFPNDRDIVVQEQSGSFYVKGRLQPTRTLGDYHLKYKQLFKGKGKFNGPYIKSQPDIRIFPITRQHKCIVMASDGVWDFVDKETVAKASLKHNPHEQVLQETLNKIADAHDKSISQVMKISAQQKRAYHDDISVAILILGNCNKTNKL